MLKCVSSAGSCLLMMRKSTYLDSAFASPHSLARNTGYSTTKMPATGAFSKPAQPTPNASRLALSMILEKQNCSVINLFEPKLDRRE